MFNTEKSNAKELRIRQSDITKESGVPQTTVSRFLNGKNVDPITGAKIAAAITKLAKYKQDAINAIINGDTQKECAQPLVLSHL